MVKYETLPTITIHPNTQLPIQHLPELVHFDDPAASVMIDFTKIAPHTILHNETIDGVDHIIKMPGVHLLLVIDDQSHFQGVIAPDDVFSEKPIKIIQERRISRQMILANMLMVPVLDITAFDIETIELARVGHIVKTLSEYKKHYAIVIHQDKNKTQTIRGIFTLSQISKQLHLDLDQTITKINTLFELQHIDE